MKVISQAYSADLAVAADVNVYCTDHRFSRSLFFHTFHEGISGLCTGFENFMSGRNQVLDCLIYIILISFCSKFLVYFSFDPFLLFLQVVMLLPVSHLYFVLVLWKCHVSANYPGNIINGATEMCPHCKVCSSNIMLTLQRSFQTRPITDRTISVGTTVVGTVGIKYVAHWCLRWQTQHIVVVGLLWQLSPKICQRNVGGPKVGQWHLVPDPYDQMVIPRCYVPVQGPDVPLSLSSPVTTTEGTLHTLPPHSTGHSEPSNTLLEYHCTWPSRMVLWVAARTSQSTRAMVAMSVWNNIRYQV